MRDVSLVSGAMVGMRAVVAVVTTLTVVAAIATNAHANALHRVTMPFELSTRPPLQSSADETPHPSSGGRGDGYPTSLQSQPKSLGRYLKE